MFRSFGRGKRVEPTCELDNLVAYIEPYNSLVHIQGVLGCQLVARTSDELELIKGNTESRKDRFEDEGVVLCPPFKGLEGGLVGV